jgi:acyl carrier protein
MNAHKVGASEAIYDKLTRVFHDVFGNEDIVVTPQLNAEDVEEWDSLAHIRMIVAVEKLFGVRFSASEVTKLSNVADLVVLIRSKL